jgi:integrase/recombinase XerD
VADLRERITRYQSGTNRPPVSGGLAAETVNAHIRALNRLWKFAADEYGLAGSPMRGIKQTRTEAKPKSIGVDDFARLLSACDRLPAQAERWRNKALLLLLADTGLRRTAVTTIRLDSLDLIQRRVSVTEKGGKPHVAFFSQFTAAMLHKWIAVRESDSEYLFVSIRTGGGLKPSGINQLLKRLKKAAGVTGFANPHAFRHGFAIRFIQAGGDVGVLQKLLGHSDISITAGYYLIFSEDELAKLRDEVDVLKLK